METTVNTKEHEFPKSRSKSGFTFLKLVTLEAPKLVVHESAIHVKYEKVLTRCYLDTGGWCERVTQNFTHNKGIIQLVILTLFSHVPARVIAGWIT